jgi:sigma-B regulation protein RsbU (phosphoserine phosphatase)
MAATSEPTTLSQMSAIDPAPLADSKILVVDDLRSSRMLIGAILNSAGFGEVSYAADGVEALEMFAEVEPDILILDLVMPRLDGYGVCRKVREDFGGEVPILIQSGVQEAAQRARAFDVGASDVVTKPINAAELVSRVCLHLERQRLVLSLRRYQRRMEDELRTAEAMQLDLLRSDQEVDMIAGSRGVSIQSHYQASNRLGGDLWDIFPIDEDCFALFLVDFSGHGVTAAINAFRLHMLVDATVETRRSPADWLAHIGSNLYRILPVQHFATAFYGVYDRRTRRLEFATAASPEAVVLKANGGGEILPTDGMLLGCSDTATYETRSVELEPGDRILLYSDALVENFEQPEQSLTPQQLAEHARAVTDDAPRRGVCDRLIKRVFGDDAENVNDDLTLIYLEFQ